MQEDFWDVFEIEKRIGNGGQAKIFLAKS